MLKLPNKWYQKEVKRKQHSKFALLVGRLKKIVARERTGQDGKEKKKLNTRVMLVPVSYVQ